MKKNAIQSVYQLNVKCACLSLDEWWVKDSQSNKFESVSPTNLLVSKHSTQLRINKKMQFVL